MPMRSRRSCASNRRSRDAICVARLLAALLGTIVTVSAPAAPWRPSDDAAILVQVPPRNPMSPLAIAERDCAANPADGPTVARLVQALTDLGRRAADPRYFGRAEAVLLRYRSNHALSPELALASADILQHRHDYVAARKVLDNLLHDAPNALQPRLMRAQMNLAQGRFDEARGDCLALLRSSALGRACLAQTLGMTGDLARGQALLLHETADAGAPAVRSWIYTTLADMAERLGDPTAVSWLERALAADPDDQYARLALADAYLAHNDFAAATRIIRQGPSSDATLLRLAVIEARAGVPGGSGLEVGQRFAEAQARGESIHLRDLALYRLEVLKDAAGALDAAVRNFDTQKEPVDVRILLRAARAAHSREALERFRQWQRVSHYQDQTIAPLVAWADTPT